MRPAEDILMIRLGYGIPVAPHVLEKASPPLLDQIPLVRLPDISPIRLRLAYKKRLE